MSTQRPVHPAERGAHPQTDARLDRAGGRSTLSGEARLAVVVAAMREISEETDPQGMVNLFRQRARELYHGDSFLSLSRRELDPPWYRITRSSRWTEDINPWLQKDRLPLFSSGLLGEMLYGDEPRLLRDFAVREDDPALDYLAGMRAMLCLPQYDGGVGLNMVVRLSADPACFDDVDLSNALLESNLFGRAANFLVVARKLKAAYGELDRENRRVAEIQRSLLPERLPRIPRLDIAVSYRTAARAGGDYYDFFDLGDGRWGVMVADVSGHGTAAAVVMAMLRTMLHARCYQCVTAPELLMVANRQLCAQAARYDGMFVTAFYGIFDPADLSLHYSCAGHPPPLLVRGDGEVCELDAAQTMPLGVEPLCAFSVGSAALRPGDTLLLYTDGVVEAVNEAGKPYGRERLLTCVREGLTSAQSIVDCVTGRLGAFTGGAKVEDDQTLLAMRVG